MKSKTKDKPKDNVVGGIFDARRGSIRIEMGQGGSGDAETVVATLKLMLVDDGVNGVRPALGIVIPEDFIKLAKVDASTLMFLLAMPDALRNFIQTELGVS